MRYHYPDLVIGLFVSLAVFHAWFEMASSNPFRGDADALTDIPEDAKKHPSGYGSSRPFTMKQLAESIGANFNSDLSASGSGDVPEDKPQKKQNEEQGGDGGGDDDEPSDNGSDDDEQEQEEEEEEEEQEEEEQEEEEQEEDAEETSDDDASPVQPAPPVLGATQVLGRNPQQLIVVNFRFNGETYNIKSFYKSNFAQVRDCFFTQHPAKKADRSMFRFQFGNVSIEGTMTAMTLLNLGIRDGAIIEVQVAGAGGGKRKVDDDTPIFLTPTLEEGDSEQVKAGLNLKTINLEPWVMGLSLPVLKTIHKELEGIKKTGSTTTLIAPYLKYVNEYVALQTAEDRHSLVKRYLRALFADAFVKYGEGGAWKAHLKFQQFIRDAKIRAEMKGGGNDEMKDWLKH